MDQQLLSTAKDLLTSSSTCIVLLPPQPDTDSLVAGLSLHLSLKQAGKTSSLGCSSLPINPPQIEGLSEIKKTIGNQKLIVSFPYKDDSIENVSYDIDENNKRFSLSIQPKPGQPPLDPSTVEFSHAGASADLVITLSINSLEELGSIYSDEKAFLDQAKIINISTSPKPSFTEVSLSSPGKSCSEVAGLLLKNALPTPSPDIATLLYRQLREATNNFQSPQIDADSFELAAFLLRHGAVAALTPHTPPPIAPSFYRPPLQPSPKVAIPPDWQKPKIFKSAPQISTFPAPAGQLR